MKKHFPLFGIAVLSLACAAIAQDGTKGYRELNYPALSKFTPPALEKIELKNGVTLYLMEDHELPFISGAAVLKTGSIYEPEEKLGLASIMGTVIRTGGSEKFPGDRIDEDLAKIAASVESGIGQDSGSISFRCLKEDFYTVFEVFTDLMRNPNFPQNKIDLAKKEISTGIARRNDNPGPIASREFQKMMWGTDSPWARTVEYEHLSRITRDDLVNFHRKYFVPNNLRLGIIGDFDAKTMKTVVESALQTWIPEMLSFPTVETKPLKPEKTKIYFADKADINQSTILLGHEAVRRDHPDYPALWLFSSILGTGGFSTRLVQVVRSDLGLAYSVRGGFSAPYATDGIFLSSCGTKCQSTTAAINAIVKECQRILAEKPSPEELETARERIVNTEIFRYDSRDKILRRQMDLDFYGYPSNFLEKEMDKIRTVSLDEVWAAGKRHLDPSRFTMVVVGNEKLFETALDSIAAVSKLDITIPAMPASALPAATPQATEKGKQILHSWLDACGGKEKVAAIRSFEMKGETMRVNLDEKIYRVPVEITAMFPDRARIQSEMFGTHVVQVLDGNSGWMKSPQGMMNIPAAQIQEAQANLKRSYLSILVRAALGDFEAQYLASETIDGAACDTIAIRNGNNFSMNLSFDRENSRLIRQIQREGTDDQITNYSDYRELDGVWIPFQSKRSVGGKVDRTVNASSYQLNVQIDEATFQKPSE